MSFFAKIKNKVFQWLVFESSRPPLVVLDKASREYLLDHVAFYRALSEFDRGEFEKKILLFLETTEVVGLKVEVEQGDRLLVAASAVILVWNIQHWHYFNLRWVILVPGSFNKKLEFGQIDSAIHGMVGSDVMHGKMILSKPALHLGFSNGRDKRNVAIHEFAHLIDMTDGDCDGFPERLSEFAFSVPWFDLVHRKMQEIDNQESNIRNYGATSKVEFFAVVTEYFFERPGMLLKKHPMVYAALKNFYKQDLAAIRKDIEPRKKDSCPCGSGERYKHCCLPR